MLGLLEVKHGLVGDDDVLCWGYVRSKGENIYKILSRERMRGAMGVQIDLRWVEMFKIIQSLNAKSQFGDRKNSKFK